VKHDFKLYNRVAFLAGHCRGVIFALLGWNTTIGFGAYSVGVYYFPSYPLDAMNINILGRRRVFSRQVRGTDRGVVENVL